MPSDLTNREKCDLLKDTITYLYEKEGRSKSYISTLLNIDRSILSKTMNEWELIKADERHFVPSSQKFLNAHKKEIIDMLDSDVSITDIAKKFNISRKSLLDTYIKHEKELLHHYNLHNVRKHNKTESLKQKKLEDSRLNYNFKNLDNEEWKPILGFENYEVSNMGRIKSYSKKYKEWYLLKPEKNSISGRYYISLVNSNGRKNLNLARVVAHTFVNGFSDENNTVDHINGDVDDNRAENLEWVSQSVNNKRAYNNGRQKNSFSKKFKYVILDDKYEFKTFRALAKFLDISETQLRRYLNNESKTTHTFKIIY